MKAFLTGSHRYGTPTEKSDVDIVVCVDLCDIKLLEALDKINQGDYPRSGCGNQSFRFGKLNLICLDEDEFSIWKHCTEECEKIKPVEKLHAKTLFRTAVNKAYYDKIRKENEARAAAYKDKEIPF